MWEWEHENWIEERALEVLGMKKDETALEWIELEPRVREVVLKLKRLTAPENSAVTRCRALESMNAFLSTWRYKWSEIWFRPVGS